MGLTHFDRQAAIRCFDDAPPSKEGAIVTRYWLSLWRGDQLPRRADFKPRNVAPQLSAIAIFDVIPGESVRCRLLGSGLVQALGQDITGQDWLVLTKPEDRPARLDRWSQVARGAIGRGLRSGFRESGAMQLSEELMLPFGEVGEDGRRQVLFHVSWRQSTMDPMRTGLTAVNGLSTEFRLILLTG
jgi:hypothetical protein